MVLALLENRKTMTRRIVNPQPIPNTHRCMNCQWLGCYDGEKCPKCAASREYEFGEIEFESGLSDEQKESLYAALPTDTKCPHPVGSQIFVKEAAWMWCEKRPNGLTKKGRPKFHYVPDRNAAVHYCATRSGKPTLSVTNYESGNQWVWKYKNARYLPRWASRITLEVTGMKVERLQDISEQDALAEGVQTYEDHPQMWHPVEQYESLWNIINGPDSWKANPYVWCYTFRRL